jgi:hypothetical protein
MKDGTLAGLCRAIECVSTTYLFYHKKLGKLRTSQNASSSSMSFSLVLQRLRSLRYGTRPSNDRWAGLTPRREVMHRSLYLSLDHCSQPYFFARVIFPPGRHLLSTSIHPGSLPLTTSIHPYSRGANTVQLNSIPTLPSSLLSFPSLSVPQPASLARYPPGPPSAASTR